MSTEKRNNEKEKIKEGVRKYRQKMSDEEKNIEREKLKVRMRNLRGEKRVTLTSTMWAPGLVYGDSELYL